MTFEWVDEGLIPTVRRLAASNGRLPYSDIEPFLLADAGKGGSHSPKETRELLDVACDQSALWMTRWMLSPTTSPDKEARREFELWNSLHEAVLLELAKHFPSLRELAEQKQTLAFVESAMRERLREIEKRPIHRFVIASTSRIGIFLNRAGYNRVGSRLHAVALFPKGSVGRHEGGR
jgi:hypothetical protein